MLETYNDTSFQVANKTEIQFSIKKIFKWKFVAK